MYVFLIRKPEISSVLKCVCLTCGPAWCSRSRASDGGGALLVFASVSTSSQNGGWSRQRRSLLRAPRSSVLKSDTFSLHLKKATAHNTPCSIGVTQLPLTNTHTVTAGRVYCVSRTPHQSITSAYKDHVSCHYT